MNSPSTTGSNPYRFVVRSLSSSLLLATCFIIARPSLQDNPKSAGAAITPTVIVRGFLNYRTTVDGTVLLFTPDAGESSTQRQSVTATTTTASYRPGLSMVVPGGSSVFGDAIAASTVEVPISATPVVHPAHASRLNGEPMVGDVVDEHWRPVVETAPVRPSFRKEPVGSTTESSQEDQSRPSVQADDISPDSNGPTSQPKAAQPKFKRPNFSGSSSGIQGLRSRSSIGSNAQVPSSSGLRRPSLIGSPPSTEASVPSAFQTRLSQTSAKLRNRFKKQPTSSSTGKPAAETSESTSDYSTVPVSSTENSPTDSTLSSSSVSPSTSSSPTVGSDEVLEATHSEKPEPRFGDQSPTSSNQDMNSSSSNGLQQGQLGLMSAGMSDSLFMGDEIPFGNQAAGSQSAESSEQSSSHETPSATPQSTGGTSASPRRHSINDKLNGWLDHHHNRFVQRPPKQDSSSSSSANKHLASSLDTLTPSFSANIGSVASHGQVKSTPVLQHAPNVKSASGITGNSTTAESLTTAPSTLEGASTTNSSLHHHTNMRTMTRVFSTVMTSTSTRVVPMQLQSSAVAVTITEQYVITKMLTAYQTLPAHGEFLVASDELSTKGPMAMFVDPPPSNNNNNNNQQQEQPISSNAVMPAAASSNDILAQEQPISFDTNKKSATDWLHDFSPSAFSDLSSQPQQQLLMQQLLSQQALGGDLQPGSGEPLDQLASSLNPSSLLAVGNIPDLNNPLVLAAAIQNPQLAAIILAAQQIQLKQRAKLAQQQHQHQQHLFQQGAGDGAQNQMALQQPSYSTNLVTAIRPSVYTVRDTMYTTRLVSFKDGRIMRTRTVSEPGSVIEQVLTTSVTEVTPVTVTIKPSGVLGGMPMGATALAGFGAGSPGGLNNAQLNNALIATQLAQLLARRQQQVQPSFLSQAQHLLNGNNNNNNFNNQPSAHRQPAQSFQPQQAAAAAAAKQFQPNIQQLLASIQQQQGDQQQQQQQQLQPNQMLPQPSVAANKLQPSAVHSPTPPLPAGPIVTTITNLQVRTYTVHNAFKVIYRTITSTQLVTSTILG